MVYGILAPASILMSIGRVSVPAAAAILMALAGAIALALVLTRRLHDRRYVVPAFLLLNAVGLAMICATIAGRRAPLLAVESFTPGEVASVLSPIRVRFNLDVVSAGQVNAPASTALLHITPAVAGRARWVTARELEFRPDRPLQKATEYRVELAKGDFTAGPLTLGGQTAFAFRTHPLTWTTLEQAGFDDQRRARLALAFDDEIVPADLTRFLRLANGRGENVPFSLVTNVRANRVLIATAPLNHDRLAVTVLAGLTGTRGPLGIENDETRPVDLDFAFVLRGLDGETRYDGTAHLNARFSSTVDAARAKAFIQVEPAVNFEARNDYWRLRLTGDFRPAARYRVTFLPGLPSTDGKVLAEAVTRSVWTPDVPPHIRFDQAGGYLSTRGNLLVNASYSNVGKARFQVTRLFPNNVVSFVNMSGDTYDLERLGEELLSKTLDLGGEKNVRQTTQFDLKALLGDRARGVLLLELFQEDQYWRSDTAVVTVTDLGVAAKVSARDCVVWVNSIRDGRPAEGARVGVYTSANQKLYEGQTDAQGLVHFAQAAWRDGAGPALITAERDGDLSYLKLESNRLTGDWDIVGRPYLTAGYEAFCFTDRGVYRPGETARAAAIVRGPAWAVPEPIPVQLEVLRPDGRTLSRLNATTDAGGAVAFDVPAPDYAPTGRYHARLRLPGDDGPTLGETAFQVEEFLPNRIEVAIETPAGKSGDSIVRSSPPLDATIGMRSPDSRTKLAFTAVGRYLFGQPAAGLRVSARARFIAAPFTPANGEGFVFGDARRTFQPVDVDLGEQTLDDAGRRAFELEVPAAAPPAALTAYLTATVTEVGGRGVTASESLTVHPYPYYLGIRPEATGYATAGEPAVFQVAAVLPDGAPAPVDRLTWTLERVEWNTVLVRDDQGYYRYRSSERVAPVAEGTVTLTDGRGRVEVRPPAYGEYRLRLHGRPARAPSSDGGAERPLTTTSSPTRPSPAAESAPRASHDFYVSGDEWGHFPWAQKKPEEIHLSTDRPAYEPGQTARLIIKSPFPGTLLLTVESDRVLSLQVRQMPANTLEVGVPVRDEYRPNVFVTATVLRAVDPEAKWMAHRAFGIARLKVDCAFKRLAVALEAPDEIRPDAALTVPIRIRDAAGRGRSAHVAVAAVDEGICALTRFQTPDPWGFFYGPRGLGVRSMDLYSRLMPEQLRLTPDRASAPGGDGGPEYDYDPRRLNPVAARRVNPVALWSGWVRADDQGRAVVNLHVPAFVGQLRLMAVAAESDCFGSAQRPVAVKSPLLVQSSYPRCLAPGDEFVVPLTLFNNTDAGGEVAIQLILDGPLAFADAPTTQETRNARDSMGPSVPRPVSSGRVDSEPAKNPTGQVRPGHRLDRAPGMLSPDFRRLHVVVPANGRADVRVPLRAQKASGKATVALVATLGGETFREQVELPVRPAAPLTASVGGGAVKAGEEAVVQLPGDWFPGTARYELLIAGEPTVSLAGGLGWLLRYPYGCVEQVTSQCFPLLYLRDLAAWVDPDLAGPGQIEHYVASGIARVLAMQTPSGGFAYWPAYRDADPWATCYAAQFLVEARKAGFEVPDASYKAMLECLQAILDASADASIGSGEGDDAARREAELAERRAYCAYVLALAGKPSPSWMTRLVEMEARLSPTARAHLAAALAASGQVESVAKLLGPALPVMGTEVQTGGHLHSPSRDLSLYLSALIDVTPDSPAIPVLVSRLEGLRFEGRWGTTQENAMALMALGKYARLRAARPNNYTATIQVPGQEPVSITHQDRRRIAGDLAGKDINIAVAGTGVLNYFWMAEGVPVSGEVQEEDRGLAVRRRLLDRTGSPLPFRERDRVRVGASQANASLPPHPDTLPPGGEGNSLGSPPARGSGTVSLRQGDLVIVELKLKAHRPVRNVVVVDLLPAGLEIENPRLATSDGGAALQSSLSPERLDLRDDRLILFTALGTDEATYYYVTRAVTAGRFRLPPAQASCMYDPAVASTHGAGQIEIAP